MILDHALRAKRLLDGAEHRFLHEARRAEADPRLGRVDIDVHFRQRQVHEDRRYGKLVTREHRTVGLDQTLGQRRVLDGTAVDDEGDLIAIAAGPLGRCREAGDAHEALRVADLEHRRGGLETEEGADPVTESRRGRSRQHGLAVVEHPEVQVRARERDAVQEPQDERQLRRRAPEKFQTGRRVEEEILDFDRGADRGLDLETVGDGPARANVPFLTTWSKAILDSVTEEFEVNDTDGIACATFFVARG